MISLWRQAFLCMEETLCSRKKSLSHHHYITLSDIITVSITNVSWSLYVCYSCSSFMAEFPPSSWVQFQSCELPIWNAEIIFKYYWSHPYSKGVCEIQVFGILVQLQNSDQLQYFWSFFFCLKHSRKCCRPLLTCICCSCCWLLLCCAYMYMFTHCTMHRGCVNTPPYQV